MVPSEERLYCTLECVNTFVIYLVLVHTGREEAPERV
jgi:hypothetical protein